MRNLMKHVKETLQFGTTARIASATATGALALTSVLSNRAAIAKRVVANRSGEGYVDTAVKILIAVVIGALVLAALYALFGDVVMPAATERVREMFDYHG